LCVGGFPEGFLRVFLGFQPERFSLGGFPEGFLRVFLGFEPERVFVGGFSEGFDPRGFSLEGFWRGFASDDFPRVFSEEKLEGFLQVLYCFLWF
jgi:hypothetical protein